MLPKTGKKFLGNDRDGGGTKYAGIVADALVAELGETHRAAKILMSWTGAGERTVKHWLAGTHGPHGDHLIVLMRESGAVFGAILTAAGRRDAAVPTEGPAVQGPATAVMDLRQLAQTAAVSDGDPAVDGGRNDRDDDRVRDRDDDRDRFRAGARSRDAMGRRQTWFRGAVSAGQHVGAAEIADRWTVSEKTARRDIAALKAEGLVVFVGTCRSGGYRPAR